MKFGSCPRIQHGFTYIALLIAVAVSGAALASIGELASRSAQREKEKELLFAGGEMRRAIGEFYERAPGGAKRYPKSLEELLEDRRQPVPQRYLRRIYPDPFSGKPEWGLVEAPEGGVMGVYSRSPLEPIRTGRFPPEYEAFEKAKSYSDWQFVYAPPAPPAQPTPK
ncbi:MAG TPA: type II secretion system protein [Burkholderiales bacterium]|nr:type II secretion system protein [Burkholderiales bacterium]